QKNLMRIVRVFLRCKYKSCREYLVNNFNIIRTTCNKLNNHTLVCIEITKVWLFLYYNYHKVS
ncbi:MAG: hypothetical protein MSH12_10455, partial [Romboutsia timonensis]|nr:hypothetical protein [Romboutsia timonensis]